MHVTVVRPGELGPEEASLWARFQKSSADLQNPFFSLTFAQAVDRHRPNARVAVVEDNGAIRAFLPFDLGARRIAMPIGDPMNNLQGFITEDAAFDARQVIRRAGLRGWRYDAAPVTQRALAPHHYPNALAEAAIIDLTDGFEAYHASRSKSFREKCKRQCRALERSIGPKSLEWGSTSSAHIRQLIDWKSARFGGSRKLFAEPAARSILEELSVSPSDECRGVVTVLRAGDQTLAVMASLAAPGVLSGWFCAYDPEMGKFSPGNLVILGTVEEAARRGVRQVELGPGQDSYKSRLSNASYPVAGGAVWAIPGERAARELYRRLRLERKGHAPRAPLALAERAGVSGRSVRDG